VKILVIAPHPDDEVLGAGGTLFRYQMMGHSTAWLIITEVPEELGWSHEKIKKREDEISHISKLFSFEATAHSLLLYFNHLFVIPTFV
jgi:hypothetical protein